MAKTKKTAKAPKAKITFRHNIFPPLMGILMMVSVFALLNSQWIVAQVQYRFLKAPVGVEQSVSTNSPASVTSPQISIPQIGVTAPVVFDEPSYVESKVQIALRQGTLHYGTTALPGQNGNMVIIGHSSGQVWTPGHYKYVFTLLDKLNINDKVVIDYQGTRYVYNITGKKTINPTDLRVLDQTTTPTLSLITCTPVGTSKYRLVVTAQQISPKPNTTAPLVDNATTISPTQLPGSAGKSIWQSIKSIFN